MPQKCHPDRSVAEWRDLLFQPVKGQLWGVVVDHSRTPQAVSRIHPAHQTEFSFQGSNAEVRTFRLDSKNDTVQYRYEDSRGWHD